MPLDPAIQAQVDAYLASIITKVRIPELPDYSLFGDLSLLDQVAVYMQATNKTVHANFTVLKALLTTGGSGTIAPVVVGSEIVHVVTAAEAGGTDVIIPALAGKTFFLRLEGRPVLPSEFEILNAGGFRIMIPGYQLEEGQRFDMQVYELMATTGGPASLSSSFFAGTIVNVNTNITLNAVNDVNKLIQVRAGASKIEITLPDVAAVAANAIVVIEATINNDFQAKIKTTGGQFIYMNNDSKGAVYLGIGETLFLFRGVDGWYVLFDFPRIYKSLGKPHAAYSYEPNENEMLCDGRTLNRDEYPRLWEKVQTLGASLVSEVVWQTPQVYRQGNVYTTSVPGSGTYQTIPKPYRGCFSDGDGATTFRIPDLMGMFLRSVKSEFGSDNERYLNEAGGYQMEAVHIATNVKGVKNTGGGTIASAVDSTNPTGEEFDLTHMFTIGVNEGVETRPENTGVLWVINY